MKHNLLMDSQKGIYRLIADAVSKLRADPFFGPRLSNKWLPAETWVLAIEKAGYIDVSFSVDKKKFGKFMSSAHCEWRDSMQRFDGSNATGNSFVVSLKVIT